MLSDCSPFNPANSLRCSTTVSVSKRILCCGQTPVLELVSYPCLLGCLCPRNKSIINSDVLEINP